jgi:surfactin synthase thioesterase subunit
MSQLTADDDLWCRRYQPARNATARLICLPHAGGSAPFFLPVSAALSPAVDVVAIQYPGRQDRPVRLFASGRRAPSTYRDETVHLRDDAGILAELRMLNGTGSALLGDDEMMRAALPALRADYQAAETHQCAADVTVACPITVLTGDSDPKTTLDEAKAWAQHTTGSFDIQVYPGGHFFLTDHADQIIKLLHQHLQTGRAHPTA